MTVNIRYDDDCPATLGERVAILGYGSQGHAHAQNLKDSGVDVRVGLHAGSKSRAKAERHGLRVVDAADAVREADIVMVLTPDVGQARLYRESIEPHLRAGMMLMFAHGFSIHFGQIDPPAGVDVTMIAPKAPGHLVRSTYLEGTGTPALMAKEMVRLAFTAWAKSMTAFHWLRVTKPWKPWGGLAGAGASESWK